VGYVEAGCCNLIRHIENVKKSGVSPVVCINSFVTDTPAEIAKIREICEAAGARVATSTHWEHGGKGALELADAVIKACDAPNEFAYLCDLSEPLDTRIEKQVTEVYGGDGVDFEPLAREKLARYQADPETASLPVCIAKTQYSLSHDPALLGRPTGWRMPVKDVLVYRGAGLIVPVAGEIKLMPGTSASPAFRRIDVDVETGKVKGLF
jgi:formate--tetrahydrofolate ligase